MHGTCWVQCTYSSIGFSHLPQNLLAAKSVVGSFLMLHGCLEADGRGKPIRTKNSATIDADNVTITIIALSVMVKVKGFSLDQFTNCRGTTFSKTHVCTFTYFSNYLS